MTMSIAVQHNAGNNNKSTRESEGKIVEKLLMNFRRCSSLDDLAPLLSCGF